MVQAHHPKADAHTHTGCRDSYRCAPNYAITLLHVEADAPEQQSDYYMNNGKLVIIIPQTVLSSTWLYLRGRLTVYLVDSPHRPLLQRSSTIEFGSVETGETKFSPTRILRRISSNTIVKYKIHHAYPVASHGNADGLTPISSLLWTSHRTMRPSVANTVCRLA